MTNKVLAALALVLWSTHSFAHAILVDATPAVNAAVTGPDVHVQLRFNARIDGTRSRLRVVMPDQKIRVLTLSPQANPATLDSQIKGLTRGMYRLQWQVLAGDGHITRGEVPFEVK
jgi:copper resistance protein C